MSTVLHHSKALSRKGKTNKQLIEEISHLKSHITTLETSGMESPRKRFHRTYRKNVEEDLRAAKEMAENTLKLKDKFLELVAHDLLAPFISMRGLLNILHDNGSSNFSESQKQTLRVVMGSCENLGAMIEELLKISRVKTGSLQLNSRFFDGYVLPLKAINDLSYLAAKKGIVIENKMSIGTRLFADPVLLGEVIRNLLSNAIKFCHKGGVITFFTPEENCATIAIKDTGIGISKADMENLFKHEVKTSTLGTGGERGTGLGLPLSYDIMEAHGGKLEVESSNGHGSTFYVKLPFLKPTVLLVDDDNLILSLLKNILADLDIDIMEARNGEQALAAIEKKKPHIVISDVKMPIMGGFDFLEKIKGDKNTESIPVIMITADSDMRTRQKAIHLGADDFSTKPMKPHDFIPRVRKYIG